MTRPKSRKPGKGSRWEREFCKMLSLWWSHQKSDSIFWRTSQSGGRATTRGKKGKETANQHGDVTFTDPSGQPFTGLIHVELKRGYSDSSIQDLIDYPDTGQPLYAEWFNKAFLSAEESKTPFWLVVVKRDRRIPLVFLPCDLGKQLYLNQKTMDGGHKTITVGSLDEGFIFVLRLDAFFSLVEPRQVEVVYRRTLCRSTHVPPL